MNSNNPTDTAAGEPVLDPETRRAINAALLYEDAITQLTDSGLSAQRRREEIKLERVECGKHERELHEASEEQHTDETPQQTDQSRVRPGVQAETEQQPTSQASPQTARPPKPKRPSKRRFFGHCIGELILTPHKPSSLNSFEPTKAPFSVIDIVLLTLLF
ncbi:MAG: hypothetical protein Q9191_006345 [Dirinaria sp. TL-2023a]